MPDRLRPARVFDAAAGAYVLEDEVALVPEQLVRQRVAVAPREGRQVAADVVTEVPDEDVEQTVAVEVERRRGTTDHAPAAEVRAPGDVLESGVSDVAI